MMRHSGWFPDYVLRLFRRGKARFTDDLVHERVVCDGAVARLDEPLLHHPVRGSKMRSGASTAIRRRRRDARRLGPQSLVR